MSKILLFAHSGFSDQNANGLTIKNLLSAWEPEEKAECYYDVQPPDFTAAKQYFRVTDMDALKAMLGKQTQRCFTAGPTPERTSAGGPQSRPLPVWLKKRNYHFGVKWLREVLRMVSPWGHRRLAEWDPGGKPGCDCVHGGRKPLSGSAGLPGLPGYRKAVGAVQLRGIPGD